MRFPPLRYRSAPVAILACLALLSGCATSPIGVRRLDPDAVHRSLTANALTEDRPSIDSRNVLHRRGLFTEFEKHPVRTLSELNRIAIAEDDNDTWFALAELSFLHADRVRDRRYSVMAAIYAWSYLFGGTPPNPFDPRLRIATDIYNRGLTQGLEDPRTRKLEVDGNTYQLPIGELTVAFERSSLVWNNRQLRDFVPVAELEVTGLDNRFRTPGIGAPLAASAAATNVDNTNDFLVPRLKTPVTVLARFDDIRREIASRNMHATLELHTDPNVETVRIGNQDVPLEKEPTAALAAMVAEAPVIKQEILAFLGSMTQRADKGQLAGMRPHVRGRIPVVFVHGTASSPARWAEMINVLDNDPRINERFEPWIFAYNSSSPIAYSAYLLRRALTDAVQALDPEGTDPGLRDMVVIGHSQGGLLTKMTAVHSGDLFWKNISSKPFEEVKLEPADRELLRAVGFVEPLPFVKRVVFICTPHRGSYLAASGWVRGLITRLVSLPVTVTRLTGSLLTLSPDFAKVNNMRSPNAVDNMSPSNPFVRTLSGIPVAPEIDANSIVAVMPGQDIATGDDGVVKYASAHIDGVETEFIVRSSHSTQAVPETIEEVRRILLKHAAEAPFPPAAAAVPESPSKRPVRPALKPVSKAP